MAGTKKFSKMSPMHVCPDSRATADLIKESTVVFMGCKIRKDTNEYKITSVMKEKLKITRITRIYLRLPNGEWRKSLQWLYQI